MPLTKPARRLTIIFALCVTLFGASASLADTPLLSAPKWKGLYYRLSLLFVSAEAEIHIRQPELKEVRAILVSPPGLSLPDPQQAPFELAIYSDNLGRMSDTRLWYGNDLKLLQMTRFDSGKKHRRKVYRYLPDGFWSSQRLPKNSREVHDESQWSVVESETVRNPEALKNANVLEDSLLFHLVSVLPLREKGESFQYYSYIDDNVFENRLQVQGNEEIEVDFVEKYPGRDKWVEGDVSLVHILLHARALDAKDQDDFQIMGLKGDLSLYVDAKTGVLVQLSGEVDYLGRVNIVLYKVEF